MSPSSSRSALAGALAAVFAIAVSELVAGVVGRGPSVLVSVGAFVIQVTPAFVQELVIRLLGNYDKPFLLGLMVTLCALAGAVLGILARQRFWLAWIGFAVFAVLGLMASSVHPLASLAVSIIAIVLASGCGLSSLAVMQRSEGRRTFLRRAGAVGALSVLSVVFGRWLVSRSAIGTPAGVQLPPPAHPALGPLPSTEVGVTGVSPLVTRNANFYRVDTALDPPRVPLDTWRLKVGGLVDRPFELSYADLLKEPMVEKYVTLACVSNEVGGDLISNACWQGIPLSDLIQRAGAKPEATYVVARSVDAFVVGFPLQEALDGRVALVAIGMNGEALPLEHGFPARLVVSGLYGYISATKWLHEIELSTKDAFTASGTARGLSTQGPVKTQSRIDVPHADDRLSAGPQVIAGVAWAQSRGVSKVEVQVDDGSWETAALADAISVDTWRQWAFHWTASPGAHVLRVRATDGQGEVQTATRRRPAPDGATGYHTLHVNVD